MRLLHLGVMMSLFSTFRLLHGEAILASLVCICTAAGDIDFVEYLPLLSNIYNVVLLYAHGRAALSAKVHVFASIVWFFTNLSYIRDK